MKRLFFIICVSIICTFVNAQEPEIKIRDQIVLGSRVMSVDPSCSPDISAYDKQSQSFVEIRPCMNLNILKYKTEDQCEMYVLSLLTLSQHSLSIPSGSRLLLKSIDGKTLELKTTEETKSRYGRYKSLFDCRYLVIPEYSISKEDIEWFCNNRVQKLRLEFFQGFADADIKPEYDMGFSSFVCRANNAFLEKTKSDKDPLYDGF